ncbi:type III pantothenate kinase [Bacillus piscicola]|uniref:type III pantothenate kinase n=1 Tax=Bacillus piscicola TaxID=1632684 RepID=UPI001F09544E|nr:type III pantothenate kinase [Bacillus piscicola]
MILAMAVGNTNTVIGLYRERELSAQWRLSTSERKTEDEYGLQVMELLDSIHAEKDNITGIIIASVVPPLLTTLEKMCVKYFSIAPMIVGPGIKTGLNIRSDNPREVGADRIVNAVAALREHSGPLIVVNLGTAATFCYIDQHGEYSGGAIAPGLGVSTHALFSEASKLPRIEITKPDHIIGRNTVDAMRSGIYYGYVGQVDSIIYRMKREIKGKPFVIATGAYAELIGPSAVNIDKVDPCLALKGLRFIYEKNKVVIGKEE